MSKPKYPVKYLGIRVVNQPQFPGDTWRGLEAIVKAEDGRKYYIPLFGVWKQKDENFGGYYYECDNNGLTWKYIAEVKEHAYNLGKEMYGEGL